MRKNKVTSELLHGLDKSNPFNKSINKNDTSDTGYESSKLGYKTLKKTKSTAKTTAKTGKTVFKATKTTAKTSAKAAKQTVRTAKTSAKVAFKTGKVVVKVASEVVIQTIALASNPTFWVVVLVLLIILIVLLLTVSLLAGGGAASTARTKAYTQPVGLTMEMEDVLSQAQVYFDDAYGRKKAEFDSLIDSLKYSTGDMPHSDLVYLKCNDGDEFLTSIATPTRKGQLKTKFSKSISEEEAIALVYVALEKAENETNGTSGEIYKVEFSDEIFDDLFDKMIAWSDTVWQDQECPQKNCSIHIDKKPNPERQEMSKIVGLSIDAYDSWGIIPEGNTVLDKLLRWNSIPDGYAQDQYWNNTVYPAIQAWESDNYDFYWYHLPDYYYKDYYDDPYGFQEILGTYYEYYYAQEQAIPEYIYTTTQTCDREHDLHAIGLDIVSSDSIMDEWNFNDVDRQWYDLINNGLKVYLSKNNSADDEEN